MIHYAPAERLPRPNNITKLSERYHNTCSVFPKNNNAVLDEYWDVGIPTTHEVWAFTPATDAEIINFVNNFDTM